MNDILSVQRRKGFKDQVFGSCTKAVKLYNSGMGGVDLMDRRTTSYCLERMSTARFYLRIFFDLMDIVRVNRFTSFII